MMRYLFFMIGVLMGFGPFFTSGASADLGPSDVVLHPGKDCYEAGEKKTLCFLVTNASPDGEAIADVDLGFPGDWTVLDCCRQGEVCTVNERYVRS